ncbi:hypothetical protein [Streptomyces sp. BA2]|uniref:hypothetical protein n=1 Tax=Streptomyces sp. BA2 TaxID=436595 RepID=UPI003014DFFA
MPVMAAEAADTVTATLKMLSQQAPHMRAPDLYGGGTGGFGWPRVNRLARTTAVTRLASGA